MFDGEILESVTQRERQMTPPLSQPNNKTQTEPAQQQEHSHKSQAKIARSNKTADFAIIDPLKVSSWQVSDVINWASNAEHFSCTMLDCLYKEDIDGEVLLSLTEQDVRDMRYKLGYNLTFGELKKFWLAVYKLQMQLENINKTASNGREPLMLGITTAPLTAQAATNVYLPLSTARAASQASCLCPDEFDDVRGSEKLMNRKCISPEYFKTAISLGYSFAVTWITSFVMVIVHERVPDMKRYPPLPDIFLDNVPHIPWAFNMCEITGSLLFTIWITVLIFHKYRMALLRRFFALAGTVFLLRCVTMLITSLSVPGTHLQCNQKDFAIDDPSIDLIGALLIRMTRAYRIWSGLGMSIQGVRTCGDYMFSGHTVALTLLNFFITEYTPRNLYFLHTLSWLLNMFGIFFILAAHEHYSIDVFVAFYITSRLFLYYHTLANNRALMQSDSTRTRIWFPMFSYFESSVDGMIPNDFDTPGALFDLLLYPIFKIKDSILMVAQHYLLRSDEESESNTGIAAHAKAIISSYFTPRQSVISGSNNNTQGSETTPLVSNEQILRRASASQAQKQMAMDASTSISAVATNAHSKSKATAATSDIAAPMDKKLL